MQGKFNTSPGKVLGYTTERFVSDHILNFLAKGCKAKDEATALVKQNRRICQFNESMKIVDSWVFF